MKHRLKQIVLSIAFGFSAVFGAQAQTSEAQSTRALELLKRARAAAGGEEKLLTVQSLSAIAAFRRVMKGDDFVMSGEITLEFLLPDKFMKAETLRGPGGAGPTMIEALNGDAEWTDVQSNSPGMFMTYGGGPGVDKETARNAAAARLRNMRQEFARYLLFFLFKSPSSLPLNFIYAGEAQAEDGRADVLDVKGAEGFAARLFLDSQTHLPLMISYSANMPLMAFGQFQGQAPGPLAGSTERAPAPGRNDQLWGRPMQRGSPAGPEMREIQIELRLSDYRAVDGLLLPYRLQQSTDGDLNEELEIKKYQVNPLLKPEKFQKKGEKKRS